MGSWHGRHCPAQQRCMQLVEHVYYFAFVMPFIFLMLSPFHFLWMGVLL